MSLLENPMKDHLDIKRPFLDTFPKEIIVTKKLLSCAFLVDLVDNCLVGERRVT